MNLCISESSLVVYGRGVAPGGYEDKLIGDWGRTERENIVSRDNYQVTEMRLKEKPLVHYVGARGVNP